MKRTDSFISIYPLFRVKDGQMASIKKITDEIISRGHGEEGTLLFTAAFSDTHLFLRESYVDHKAFHVHLDTVKDILDEFFSLLELESLVVVASADDIEKMKFEMKTLGMQATYCVINNGFSI
jgi:quinol monooxygenase YgiN